MMNRWNYFPNHYYWSGAGFSILSIILTVLFWGLIIMLIVKLVRSARCQDKKEPEEENGENKNIGIVKERYAKGEIDKKEFEQLKRDLA
jgi:putative membrane protein